MKTLHVHSNGQWQEVVGSPSGLEDYAKIEYVNAAISAIPATDLSGYYTKLEADAAIKVCRDEGALDLDAVQNQVLYAVTETARQLQEMIALKANASEYVKLDDKNQVALTKAVVAATYAFGDTLTPDVAIKAKLIDGVIRLVFTPGGNKQEIVAYQSDAAADLSSYAKSQDNQQALLSKTVTAQAYGFGDALLPPVALAYTDTNEGYGNRLVLNIGLTNEYLVYKSDLDVLNSLLPRVEAMESKAAPVVDLAPYVTLETADALYGRKDALDLLRNQTQTIFDSIYTRAEADARYASKPDVYTQKQTDDRFMRIEQAFSKADFDNQMALFLYSRKQVDDKLAVINPLGSPSINDPALAAFKQSVLDEVKKLMAGGKTIPADVPWTNILNAGNSASTPQAKVLNGVVYLRGEVVKSIGSGYIANVCQLPATIPPPPKEMVIPLACKNTSPAGRHFGYATFQVNRQIGVSCDNALNTIWLDGISYPAYE